MSENITQTLFYALTLLHTRQTVWFLVHPTGALPVLSEQNVAPFLFGKIYDISPFLCYLFKVPKPMTFKHSYSCNVNILANYFKTWTMSIEVMLT